MKNNVSQDIANIGPQQNWNLNRSPMPIGANNLFANLLGNNGNQRKLMNNGINGVGSNLIGQVVQDEKKDSQPSPEKPKIDTETKLYTPEKINKNSDLPTLRDMIELEKLKYLQGFNKENKEKKRIDTKQGFEHDYSLIEDVKNGGYLYDILNDKRYINYK